MKQRHQYLRPECRVLDIELSTGILALSDGDQHNPSLPGGGLTDDDQTSPSFTRKAPWEEEE